jgi:hydrogenase maturation factor
MLTSVEGVYRNGRIELIENPSDVPEGTWVIVTFVRPNEIDLESRGIQTQ